jgi:hypothetical protein
VAHRLKADELRAVCDPAKLPFRSTQALGEGRCAAQKRLDAWCRRERQRGVRAAAVVLDGIAFQEIPGSRSGGEPTSSSSGPMDGLASVAS